MDIKYAVFFSLTIVSLQVKYCKLVFTTLIVLGM